MSGVSLGADSPGVEAGFLLDTDAVVIPPRGVTDGILAGLGVLQLWHIDAHGDVLAWLEVWQWLAIDGLEIERGDLVRLAYLPGHAELAPVGPAPALLVQCAFAVNHDVRQRPGVKDVIYAGITENLLHSFQQVFHNDLIIIRVNVERSMLLQINSTGRPRAPRSSILGSVCEKGTRQRPCLVAIDLVGRVEHVVEFRMLGQVFNEILKRMTPQKN